MAADVFMCSPRRPRSRVRSVLLKPQVPEDDDDSDTDEPSPPPASGAATSARAHASAAPLPPRAGPGREEPPRPQQIIHSGHFMVSSPHREHPPKKGYDFDTVNKQTCQTYSFGKTSSCHLSIDASLTKLFECMTLAYSGKLVSPKWKNFKGLKLQWRDKIRLNNAIWRAWYMQYLEKRKNPVCHFVTPLDGSVDVDEHRRPEAITTEGKYWKSRIEFVIREYHKWRTYFKKRLQQHKDEDLSSLAQDDDMLYWHKHGDGWKTPVPMEEDPLLDTDMLMSEFSDTLFSTLSSHQPVAWPNPREIAHLGNADMIQPGLIPLQPNLDFMDTFEPFQDLFSSSRSIFGSMLPTPASAPVPDPNSPPAQGSVLPASALPTPQKFTGVSKSPPVITHTASTTLTHTACTTTFSQSQGLVITARHPTSTPSPCGLALSPAPLPPAAGPLQPRLTFVHPKPVSLTGGRPKQSPKIVPASKPKPMSLVLKNAHLTPAAFSGQPQAVIMTSGPPKREGMLASTVSQSSVVIAPAAIARAPGVTEFHSSVLVTDLSHSTSSQPTPVSRIFSPSTVQDSLVKGEQAPLHGGSPQVPATGSSRDCPNSGQASPCASEQSPSPQSPQNNCSGKSADTKNVAALKQNRQMKHISAEQKRRFNIKMGFHTLNSLISNNSKPTSHAITLQKTMEYITKLQQERSQMQEEARRLRDEIEELNATILSCQQLLPDTGVSLTRLQFDHMRDMFDEYVKSRILQNWKFWIFSIIIKPLFESFKGMVSTRSLEELQQTALSWLDQHCSLPILRPMVLSTLRQLSITTSVLTDPSQLPEQASEAVTRIGKRSGES
ncbi:MLX-interacting protein isoform X3 [Sciurus carolinensis]|uniref:MLX-interacting protein isoform X3 n=1 Tax=Sciurus carolinensis TaxID=30640 RepID=UPI001FB4536E|nr:MLX-interacting protein isoform X3 [Sciurus carolinensis]